MGEKSPNSAEAMYMGSDAEQRIHFIRPGYR